SSAGKTFSTTGWKIGWLTAAPELRDAVLAVKQFLSYVNGAPFQPAIALGLDLPDTFYAGTAATLQHKRDLLIDGLRAAGFGVSRPAGSYFVIADAAPLGHPDAAALCRGLPELAGVVGTPLSAFAHPARRAPHASAAPLGHRDAEARRRGLPVLAGVGGTPRTAFVHPDGRAPSASLVRFALCRRGEVIAGATRRLGTRRGWGAVAPKQGVLTCPGSG